MVRGENTCDPYHTKKGKEQNMFDVHGTDHGWGKRDVRENRGVGTLGVTYMRSRAGRIHESKTRTGRDFGRNLVNDSCKETV